VHGVADTYEATDLTAKAIFAKYHAARGERAPGNYHEVVHVHTGGVDRTQTTYMDADNYITRYEGGGFSSAEGYYRKQSWDQDENGIVTLRSEFRSQEDPNELALEHPEDPKYNVRVLGITQGAPRQYVVEINPPGGFDQYRYFDASSFLLMRTISFTRDRHRHVTDYSDYRTVYGETIAFALHAYDGRPQNDTTMSIQAFEKVDTQLDLSIPASTPIFSYSGNKPIDLPARFTSGGIIIRAIVNGRGLDFLLDSGASELFIDPGVAHELGLTPFGRNSKTIGGGDVDMGSVRLAHMSIGSLTLDNVVFETAPFDEEVDGSRVVGFIGFDLLASGVFGIDFKAQKVTYYPSSSFDPKALGLTALPLQLDDGIPRTDVWVEGVHGHFLVDTGAFKLLVYRDFANRLPSVPVEEQQARIDTVGGGLSSSLVDLTDVVFGKVKYRSAQAMEPNSSTFDIRDYDGLIGRDVLSNYQSYFDYADGVLFVKPNI